MHKTVICLFLPFTVTIVSCDKIIEIDIPKKEPVITVNSLFAPFTAPYPQEFIVELTSSVPIFDTSNFKTIIPDADVYLFENNEIIDTLEYIDTAEYYISSVYPQTGKEYKLEVSKTGFNKVTCYDIVPERVLLDSVSLISYAGLTYDGAPFSEITLSFIDPGNLVNYYEIALTFEQDFDYYIHLSTNDEIISSESYYPSVLMFDAQHPQFLPFRDIECNGTAKELKIYYTPPRFYIVEGFNESFYIDSHIIDIHFRSISEKYYKFRTSFLQQLCNRRGDALFGMNEPMNVYTNAENGYGIFAAYQTDIVTIEVDSIQIQ